MSTSEPAFVPPETTPEPGTIWGQNTLVSATQVRAMDPQLVHRSVLMTIEAIEAKARRLGIENPEVHVMFIAEFRLPLEAEE